MKEDYICIQLNKDNYREEYGKEIARLIYDTDPYIYPALFGNRKNAELILERLIHTEDTMFRMSNIYAAILNNHVIAIILWHKGTLIWEDKYFRETVSILNLEISPHFETVKKGYISGYESIESNTIAIINVCVAKEYRNKGVGSKIIDSFLRIYSEETVELCALEQNLVAIKLYEKLGFQKQEMSPGFTVDDRKIKCITMRRKM